jgi:hypothetical protein
MKNSMEAPQKIEFPYNSAIPFLRLYPNKCESANNKRHLHTHVYCSSIHNSQAMEIAKMPHY